MRTTPRPHGVAVAILVATVAFAGCGGAPSKGPEPSPSVGAAPGNTIAVGLDAPWSIAFAGGATLVSERDRGRIVEIVDGKPREVGLVDGVVARGEFGQNTWDELNLIRPGGNYGWPVVEGIARREGFVDPLQQWSPRDASPSGIAIIGNDVLVANLRGQRVRTVPLSAPGTSSEQHRGEFGRIRDVVHAPDGSTWILTKNTDGRGSPRPGDDRIVRLTGGGTP